MCNSTGKLPPLLCKLAVGALIDSICRIDATHMQSWRTEWQILFEATPGSHR